MTFPVAKGSRAGAPKNYSQTYHHVLEGSANRVRGVRTEFRPKIKNGLAISITRTMATESANPPSRESKLPLVVGKTVEIFRDLFGAGFARHADAW